MTSGPFEIPLRIICIPFSNIRPKFVFSFFYNIDILKQLAFCLQKIAYSGLVFNDVMID